MQEKINEINLIMNQMDYGFKDSSGQNIINNLEKWDNEFDKFYYLQTPEELLISKCGVCWDQVELERRLFSDNNINFKTYFIYIIDNDMLPSHTFLVYNDDKNYYWFEHSWGEYKGIHKYNSIKNLFDDVIYKFKNSHKEVRKNSKVFLYEYEKPKYHITCNDFYKYIETQNLIETNTK